MNLTGGKVVGSVYGGAKNADISRNIEVGIHGGRYNRIFGGNNLGGTIHGTITVNSEENATQPIVIGQLYGGGNQAAYTAPSNPRGETALGPTLTLKSFTSIDEIFGGGNNAEVTGNTHVVVGAPPTQQP